MNKEFKMAYVWIKEELQNAVAKNRKDVALWKKYLGSIPYCDLAETSGEEILRGVQLKGYIDLWKKFPFLDSFCFEESDDEDDDEDLDPCDKNEETRQKMTARFFFKEHDQAVLIYPPNESLPKFKGTWGEVTFEIIDFVRRKFCDDPEPPKDLAERIKLFRPGAS